MNLYISDMHFGHKNVIKFDHRPFADVEEMDICLCHFPIAEWNGFFRETWHIFYKDNVAYY